MMKSVDCEETKSSVHEYLHGELHEPDMDGITAHLANCESCEQDYDLESLLNQVIHRSCDEAPPAELALRVISRIRDIQSHPET